LILIVNLSSIGAFPVGALSEVDATLAEAGFKKEVHSVIKPGRELSATYSGPRVEKSLLEGILGPVVLRNRLTFTLDFEDSVSFP
jgi:hypothetical protein